MQGWIHGLAVKSICCTCRGPEFSSQHPHGNTTICNFNSGGDLTSSFSIYKYYMHGEHIHIWRQNIHALLLEQTDDSTTPLGRIQTFLMGLRWKIWGSNLKLRKAQSWIRDSGSRNKNSNSLVIAGWYTILARMGWWSLIPWNHFCPHII